MKTFSTSATNPTVAVGGQDSPTGLKAVLQQQQQTLRELLCYLWGRSVFYREYYRAHGIKENDLAEITIKDLPFLSKQLLMENFDSAITDPTIKRKDLERWIQENPRPGENFCKHTIVIHSSGSSGSVGTFVYDQKAWQLANGRMANELPLPENYPSGKTRVAFYLASHGHFGGISTAARMPKAVYDTMILSLRDSREHVTERLNAFQPHRLQGYASTIARLAQIAIDGKLHISPKSIFISGDKLTESMAGAIQKAWSAPLYNLYSASESKCIAIKEPGQVEMRVLDDLNIVEVLDDNNQSVADGETGRVVLTNLYNYLLPVLRYELGDQVQRGQPRNDAKWTTLRDIKGRINTSLPILLHDGSHDSIHPMLLEDFHVPGLTKIQFISLKPDEVEIDYMASVDVDAAVRTEFQKLLTSKNASRTTFRLRRVPYISTDPQTGKINLIRIADPSHHRIQWTDDDNSRLRAEPALGVAAVRPVPQLEDTAMEQSITDLFERTARLHANRLAIKTTERSLTYEQLNRAANKVARVVLETQRARNEPIALLLDHHLSMVVAILGVLKAGKTYVPLDPKDTSARSAGFLEDSHAITILTDSDNLPAVERLLKSGQSVINVDAIEATVCADNLRLAISPNSLACILYTSGSSGRPKGVIQNHRNVIHNALLYAKGCRIGPGDRVTLLAALGTGQGTPTAFSALLSGATLLPYKIKEDGVIGLSNWLSSEEITVYISAPTLFRQFVGTLTGAESFANLRLIRLGAEQVQKSDIELYKKYFPPNCSFAAFLSSTETGNLCQFFLDKETEIVGEVVPAGFPVHGVDIRLLDDGGNEVGSGEIGEIVVKSRYLSPGYWQNSDLTHRSFSNDPMEPHKRIYHTGDLGRVRPDGSLEHLGRKDFRVKIRGNRVETTEIETALMAMDEVKEAVVMVRETASDDRSSNVEATAHLVAYIVPAAKISFTVSTLRRSLREKLPEHMIPTVFVMLEVMPLTPLGKVDRRALSDPGNIRPRLDTPYAPPRTTVEKELAFAWAEVLVLDQVGIYDNFFDLGGHSLAAMRIISQIIRRFQLELSIQALFAAPTIAELAAVITDAQKHKVDEKHLDQILNGLEFLTDDEVRQLLTDESESQRPNFKNERFER